MFEHSESIGLEDLHSVATDMSGDSGVRLDKKAAAEPTKAPAATTVEVRSEIDSHAKKRAIGPYAARMLELNRARNAAGGMEEKERITQEILYLQFLCFAAAYDAARDQRTTAPGRADLQMKERLKRIEADARSIFDKIGQIKADEELSWMWSRASRFNIFNIIGAA